MKEYNICEVCGATYNVDNLMTCKGCRKMYCYRGSGSNTAYCKYCDKPAPEKASSEQRKNS